MLVTPAKHPLAGKRRLAFKDVLAHDTVGLPIDRALQQHIEGHAARLGATLRPRLRLPGFDALCRVVESGIGVAVVSQERGVAQRQVDGDPGRAAPRSVGAPPAAAVRQIRTRAARPGPGAAGAS